MQARLFDNKVGWLYLVGLQADRDWITDAMNRMGEAFEKAGVALVSAVEQASVHDFMLLFQ